MIELRYKDQLENLLHGIRSPLVVLSMASENIVTLTETKEIVVSPDKVDEYNELLNFLQSSVKRLNGALSQAQENLLMLEKGEI